MEGDLTGDGTAAGSASAAGWTWTAAGKTGTTQEYKSSAYLGFTPEMSASVILWDSEPRPQSICRDPIRTCSTDEAMAGNGVSGGSVPAATWFAAMKPLKDGQPDTFFRPASPAYLKGSASTQVPSVIGKNVDEAKAQLTAAGFTVNIAPRQNPAPRSTSSSTRTRSRPRCPAGRSRWPSRPAAPAADRCRRSGPLTVMIMPTASDRAGGGRFDRRGRGRRRWPGRRWSSRRLFALRRIDLPVLDPGAWPIRLLHLSDLHIVPGQQRKTAWVRALADLRPDLVINTGDTLSHLKAVPAAVAAFGDLLDVPGAFVFGNNDFYAPVRKSPHRYFLPSGESVPRGAPLPWQDLRAAQVERGWLDLNNAKGNITVRGQRIALAGVNDPYTRRDRYEQIAGPADRDAVVRIGVTHAPEPRVLDRFAADGYDLVLAGHTHGGQVRVPGIGALVTNCGIDRSRARGLSRWGSHTLLNVSAGLGTSPYLPMRFCCRPEATLITLQPADVRRAARRQRPTGRSPVDGPGHRSPSARLVQAFGVWRSLVARFVRDEEVAGSNPVTPTRMCSLDRRQAVVGSEQIAVQQRTPAAMLGSFAVGRKIPPMIVVHMGPSAGADGNFGRSVTIRPNCWRGGWRGSPEQADSGSIDVRGCDVGDQRAGGDSSSAQRVKRVPADRRPRCEHDRGLRSAEQRPGRSAAPTRRTVRRGSICGSPRRARRIVPDHCGRRGDRGRSICSADIVRECRTRNTRYHPAGRNGPTGAQFTACAAAGAGIDRARFGNPPCAAVGTVSRLRTAGWRIALDDVGADDMSLAFMPLLQPDIVKLDLSLVQKRPDAAVAEIMNAVNAYAESTGALLLAEGIESDKHLMVARALGARLGQGWMFGRPSTNLSQALPVGAIVFPSAPPAAADRSPFNCLPANTQLRVSTKPLLIEISKSLERQAMRFGGAGMVVSTFQQARYFTPLTARRYRSLVDRGGFVAAIGEGLSQEPVPGLRGADLADDDPVRSEWDIVVLAPHFSAALLARDLGDNGPDRARRFEFALTYDRTTVIAAAQSLLTRVLPTDWVRARIRLGHWGGRGDNISRRRRDGCRGAGECAIETTRPAGSGRGLARPTDRSVEPEPISDTSRIRPAASPDDRRRSGNCPLRDRQVQHY